MNEDHPQNNDPAPANPPVAPQGDHALSDDEVNSKKILCGVLGILLGGLGIHKFVLGMTTPAVIMLVVWLVGLVTVCFGGFIISSAMSIIGLVEGIIYLTKSNDEFRATYIEGKKEWF